MPQMGLSVRNATDKCAWLIEAIHGRGLNMVRDNVNNEVGGWCLAFCPRCGELMQNLLTYDLCRGCGYAW